jgi:hypothetical protein
VHSRIELHCTPITTAQRKKQRLHLTNGGQSRGAAERLWRLSPRPARSFEQPSRLRSSARIASCRVRESRMAQRFLNILVGHLCVVVAHAKCSHHCRDKLAGRFPRVRTRRKKFLQIRSRDRVPPQIRCAVGRIGDSDSLACVPMRARPHRPMWQARALATAPADQSDAAMARQPSRKSCARSSDLQLALEQIIDRLRVGLAT